MARLQTPMGSAYLTEIQWRGTDIHIVYHSTLHQLECLVGASGLPVGKGGVHHLGYGNVVDAP